MISLFDLMFNVFIWVVVIGLCVFLYAYGMALVMYATAMRQVLEERKHQRQIELMEMTLDLERVRNGQVTHSAGDHCGRVIHCPTDGESHDAFPNAPS